MLAVESWSGSEQGGDVTGVLIGVTQPVSFRCPLPLIDGHAGPFALCIYTCDPLASP